MVKDLDHNQENTDVLVKAVKPADDFMKSEGLCPKCHGPLCDCEDCPCTGE